jgi:hypothetical protein
MKTNRLYYYHIIILLWTICGGINLVPKLNKALGGSDFGVKEFLVFSVKGNRAGDPAISLAGLHKIRVRGISNRWHEE